MDNTILDYFISIFSEENQDLILIEEMSELTKEILKRRRGNKNQNKIIEEFSHVVISMNILKRILNLKDSEIESEINKKYSKYKLLRGD